MQINELPIKEQDDSLYWNGTYGEYLDIVQDKPQVACTAYQRLYSMIKSYGTETYEEAKDTVVHYKFFDDPIDDGKDAVYGIDQYLMNLVDVFKSASQSLGPERRILLLHGPVGSAKSTIARLLKKGLSTYSRIEQGQLYAVRWYVDKDDEEGLDILGLSTGKAIVDCPLHEEPLRLIPEDERDTVLDALGLDVTVEGQPCPMCRHIIRNLLPRYDGDWRQVLANHVKVYRLVLSEVDRIGIGTFQPQDEKNQDSTDLTGDINYRKLAIYGSESDPRSFGFSGEFEVANRGILELIEVLKLSTEFLYDLLGATQEHLVKPKRFAQIYIDEVLLSHSNNPEYKKLQNDEYMEALRDRTLKIDIPYVTKLEDEIKIYKKEFSNKAHQHIAPHTLEIASMWGILTRLEEPVKRDLSLVQKLKLYNGKDLPGYTVDTIKELKAEAENEAMNGISPRYIQDKMSNALVSNENEGCLSPFLVFRELEKGLAHHSLINSDTQRKKYKNLLSVVREEFEDIVKAEVQKAIAADKDSMSKLCDNYIDNVQAYVMGEKVKDPITGEDVEPNGRLMRSIEERIDITEGQKDDFRNSIMSHIAAISRRGEQFKFDSNERLNKALELKLFEDQKDSIKLTQLVSQVVDNETQQKIDVVKQRLIDQYNYCDICATEVLNFVASIFARGEQAEDVQQN